MGTSFIVETKFDIEERIVCVIGVATGFGLNAISDMHVGLAILGGLGFWFSALVFVLNPVRMRVESRQINALPLGIARPVLTKIPQPKVLSRIRLNRISIDNGSNPSREPSNISSD